MSVEISRPFRTSSKLSDINGMANQLPTPISCPLCRSSEVIVWLHGPDRFHSRDRLYRLLQCKQCLIVWLNDPPDGDEISEHYGSGYHDAIMKAAEGSVHRWSAHRETICRHKASGVLLDIGCSSGSFLKAFTGMPWKLHGIEISEAVANRARARTGAEVFVGDVLDASFPPESIDVVTSFDVLEHLQRPRDVVSKVWQWLKPGGIFYVFVPNVSCWEARLFQSYWFGLELPRHLFHYSPQSLRRLMASEGFIEQWLVTPPLNYLEYSTRYVLDDVCRRMGFVREPLVTASAPNILLRIPRKALRLTALSAFSRAASRAVAGPAIEAMFVKDALDGVAEIPSRCGSRSENTMKVGAKS